MGPTPKLIDGPAPIRSACTYDCPDACGLLVVNDGGEPRLRGDPDHPITRGFLCHRIRRHLARLAHAERVTTPRLRGPRGWRDVEWPDALDIAAERLRRALDGPGPESIVLLTGGGSLGVRKLLTSRFFHRLGPVTTVAGGACDEAGVAAQRLDFGDAACHDLDDLAHSAAVVLWGKNPAATGVHLVPRLRAASRRGAPVVLIEIRETETTGLADRVVRVAPSGDGFLALALLRWLDDRDRLSPAALERVENASDFLAFLRSEERSVERSARRAGVTRDDVRYLAGLYGGDGPVATWVGGGLQRRASGGRNVRCIDALGLLTGQVGRPGGGVSFTTGRTRGLDRSLLPPARGRTLRASHLGRDLLALDRPRAEVCWIATANPVTQHADSSATRRALREVGFTIVADAFFTDTAEAADLLLPVRLMLEEDDVVASYQHHYVARARAALAPPEGARSDDWILAELGRRLGLEDPWLEDPDGALRALTAPWIGDGATSIRRNPFQAPVPFAEALPTATGRATLITEAPELIPDDDEYPLVLLTPSCRRWQTSQRAEADQRASALEIQLHPDAAGTGGALEAGEAVIVESPIGRLEAKVRLDDTLDRDLCVMLRGGWVRYGQGVNLLVEPRATDLGGGVSFYDQRVRVTRPRRDG